MRDINKVSGGQTNMNEAKYNKLITDLQNYTKKFEGYTRDFNDLTKKYDELHIQWKETNDKLNKYEKSLKKRKVAIKEQEQKIEELNKKNNDLNDKLTKNKDSLDKVKLQIGQKDEEIEELQKTNEIAKNKLKEKENNENNKIQGLQTENNNLKDELEATKSQLESAQKTMKKYCNEISSITNVTFSGVGIENMAEIFSAVIDAMQKMAQSSAPSEAEICEGYNENEGIHEGNNVLKDGSTNPADNLDEDNLSQKTEEIKSEHEKFEEKLGSQKNVQINELIEDNNASIAKSNASSEEEYEMSNFDMDSAKQVIQIFVDAIKPISNRPNYNPKKIGTMLQFIYENIDSLIEKINLSTGHEINIEDNGFALTYEENASLKKANDNKDGITKKALKTFAYIVHEITGAEIKGDNKDFKNIEEFIKDNIDAVKDKITLLKTESSKSGDVEGDNSKPTSPVKRKEDGFFQFNQN